LRDYISTLRPLKTSNTSSGSQTAFTSSPLSVGATSNTYFDVDYDALLNLGYREIEIKDNPFAFTPKQLARLHDPKSLDVLRAMGGLFGLTMGLRTNIKNGLSPHETRLVAKLTLEQVRHEVRERDLLEMGPSNEAEAQKGHIGDSYISLEPMETILPDIKPSPLARTFSLRNPYRPAMPFEDRRRVFSSNSIPLRKGKNIFQLMWVALKDKILVRRRICLSDLDSLECGGCRIARARILPEFSSGGRK